MHLPQPLQSATMLHRPHRFGVWADIDGREVYAHVPNSGRLRELLYPGAPLLLHPVDAPGRKTTHEVVLARQGRFWVAIDSRPAPTLWLACCHGPARPLGDIITARREVTVGSSRFDLQIETADKTWLIETKSVTLSRSGHGFFPDAPTLRGTRHVRELTRLAAEGQPTAVVFVALRADITQLSPVCRSTFPV
jgi:sugar fermentation stimulation protein A